MNRQALAGLLLQAAAAALVLLARDREALAQTCAAPRIEAESAPYSQGVATEPTTDAGGGLNVGWIDAGDWMAFPVTLPQAGAYRLSYRVASNVAAGGALRVEIDAGATLLGALDVPGTGGWQQWVTVSHVVTVPRGGALHLGVAAASGGWNLNWLTITPADCSAGLTARQAAAEMGRGFNLGQMFDNTQHPRTLAAARAKIDAYYARGFRNVRIPITWTEPVGGDLLVHDPGVGQVNRGHPRLAVITQVIDHALSKPGLYVIINAHHEKALKTHSRGWVLERPWQDISDLYRTRDARLLYEILNEPHREDAAHSEMPAAELRAMTGRAYARIRAVDPRRIVIIGGNQWFHYTEMARVWPHLDDVGRGADPYVMATFHHYDPWSFCGDGQGDYADAWSAASIGTPMDVMRSWADGVGRGMPVYIGEWGVGWGSRYSTMDCNNIRLWYQMFHRDMAGPRGMPTAVWDDGGWFGIFDHGLGAFANNLIDCIATGTCAWNGGDRVNAACY
jgi:endoglucanase